MAENEPIVVVVTGAAGQIAYSLIFMIANGDVFGTEQPVILHILDIPLAIDVLEGVCMEIEDLALPLVKGYLKTTDPKKAFEGVDVAFLLGSVPRIPGMLRYDFVSKNVKIFKEHGEALDRYAKKDVKVLVVGSLANTKALICSFYAPSIPKSNFTAMARLDQNRAHSAIAKRLGICVSKIKNVTIWGNHSMTQFPDAFNASVQLSDDSISVYNSINDSNWIENEFIETVQNRGEAVIQARKSSSGISTAKAAADHMRDWWFGTPEGTWVSMGVVSDGSYGVPRDLICSMPVSISNKQWKVVEGLKITDFARIKLDSTAMELLKEKEEVMMICNS